MNIKSICLFIAEKLVQYMNTHHPEYIATHSLFRVENVQGQLLEYIDMIALCVLLPLVIYIAFKLYERHYQKKHSMKLEKLFSKKAAIIFSALFIAFTSFQVVEIIGGYKPQDYSDGFSMENLQYQPGNQPITDEITDFAKDKVVPELVETGEAIAEVVSDPKLASELLEETTGLNINEIVDEIK